MAETKGLKKLEDWKDMWDQDDIGFHQKTVHAKLQQHFPLLCPEGEKKKFFVPLCGKTLDMKWLSDQGHAVVGVEAVKKALEDFYTEHGLEWTEEDALSMGPNCKLLKQKDGQIKLFFGDVYLFTKSVDGQFDIIWDRASLVAINREDVKKYADLMKDLLKSNGKMLVEVFEYDVAIFEGRPRPPPPHPVFEEEIRSIYEPECTVQLVEKGKRMLGDKEVDLVYYLIVKK